MQNQRGRCPAHGAGGKDEGQETEMRNGEQCQHSLVSRAPQCADKKVGKKRGMGENSASTAEKKQNRGFNELSMSLRRAAPEGEKAEEKKSAGRKKRTAVTVL